jgi:hypothetical protein
MARSRRTQWSAGVLAGWLGGVSPPNRQTLNFAGNTTSAQAFHSAARTQPGQPARRQRSGRARENA